MAGENILVVDDSVAVQEICRQTLEGHGYRVTVASNGAAAVSYPDLPNVDLLIIDTELRGVSGLETTKAVKTDPELHSKPVLLLVREEDAAERESQNLYGANGWLVKPFEPGILALKVQVLLEEAGILQKGREYLRGAADSLMQRLADTHIQEAVDQKTQIIVERALQAVVTQVDQRAKREVDAKVTQLTADKEQELVKMTVHEVARSMVEKLAERKVTEAMENILRLETEKAVVGVAESMLPGLVRDRLRENIEQLLPKEIQRRVQKEAENMVPEASQKVISIIDSAAQKIIPKAAKEIVTEMTDRALEMAIEKQLPRHVQILVSAEIDGQIRQKMGPIIREAVDRIHRRVTILTAIMLIILGAGVSVSVWQVYFHDTRFFPGRAAATAPAAEAVAPAAPAEAPASPVKSFLDRFKTKPAGPPQ